MKLSFSYLSLLLFFIAFHSITAANLIIQETCRKCAHIDPNIHYNFCVASLQASPDAHCANLRQLGIISLKITSLNVTDTGHYIKDLLKSKRLDPKLRACLNDCLDLYSDAIPALKQAIKDYNSNRYEEANIVVSSVTDASTTCEDGFKEIGIVSPLTGRNNNTFELSAIALSIINMLH
ncbi:hypothetical protein P3X46_014541 [Hevea brasiliensis]|uniref:Pectinesterase inhibitor domain-containing protein n=1 Tax=Hevea brasiliensis TaxID=3981 RepID=A0ABQ9LUA9_HEVBR|nr:putative invertase inhibitor [Hevea brasiliensis]KAJ9171138.1 hypothetical protein P3X46_014541 [Hevea brasiliensis]